MAIKIIQPAFCDWSSGLFLQSVQQNVAGLFLVKPKHLQLSLRS